MDPNQLQPNHNSVPGSGPTPPNPAGDAASQSPQINPQHPSQQHPLFQQPSQPNTPQSLQQPVNPEMQPQGVLGMQPQQPQMQQPGMPLQPGQQPSMQQPGQQTPAFNQIPSQPGMPPQPMPASSGNDTLGIIGIVLAVIAPLIGIIISVIGMKKAKEEGRSPKLAKIGLIVGIISMAISLILSITILLNNFRGAQEASTNVNAPEEIAITTSSDLNVVCETKTWPTNTTASASGKITATFRESTVNKGSYRANTSLVDRSIRVDTDNQLAVDRVACASLSDEKLTSKTCEFKDGPSEMKRLAFNVDVYSIKTREKIASQKIDPSDRCPFFAILESDGNFTAGSPDKDKLDEFLLSI